jgi:DNA polymerase-1
MWKTLFGRKSHIKDINAKNFMLRSFAERQAINAPIQGTASDLIKIAMLDIHRYLEQNKCKSKMTSQVHDELLFEIIKMKKISFLKSLISWKHHIKNTNHLKHQLKLILAVD